MPAQNKSSSRNAVDDAFPVIPFVPPSRHQHQLPKRPEPQDFTLSQEPNPQTWTTPPLSSQQPPVSFHRNIAHQGDRAGDAQRQHADYIRHQNISYTPYQDPRHVHHQHLSAASLQHQVRPPLIHHHQPSSSAYNVAQTSLPSGPLQSCLSWSTSNNRSNAYTIFTAANAHAGPSSHQTARIEIPAQSTSYVRPASIVDQRDETQDSQTLGHELVSVGHPLPPALPTSAPAVYQTALTTGNRIYTAVDEAYRNYGLQERQFPPFGPFGKSGPIFPSTLTGKFIKNHIKRRSQTSAVLFGVASILGVSPNSLWRHVCGEDRQPNILQCDPALLLAIHTRLVQEHPEAMERIDTYMRDQRNLGLDALIQQGDTLVCFWVLFNLQYPKATGAPFRLDISHEMRGFKRLYTTLSNQLYDNLDY